MAGKTEYRLPYGRGGFGMTKDLFGFIDVLVVESQCFGVTGLQVTSDACLQRRVHKIMDERTNEAIRFLTAGNKIEVWGYKRVWVGNRVLWDARRKLVSLDEDGNLVASKIPDLSELRKQDLNRGKPSKAGQSSPQNHVVLTPEAERSPGGGTVVQLSQLQRCPPPGGATG